MFLYLFSACSNTDEIARLEKENTALALENTKLTTEVEQQARAIEESKSEFTDLQQSFDALEEFCNPPAQPPVHTCDTYVTELEQYIEKDETEHSRIQFIINDAARASAYNSLEQIQRVLNSFD